MKVHTMHAIVLSILLSCQVVASDKAWTHTGSIHLLTTPEGANLDESVSLEHFPVLVRLHKDYFDFTQAKADGDDIRFTSSDGTPLSYQIEAWDAATGHASIWVRIPVIKGNARQAIKIHWGNARAVSESDGKAVFNATNGYLSVWHMNGPVKDVVGTLESKDVNTTPADGIIGQARHFAGGQGIYCGDMITTYPTGSDSHSSQAWFKAEKPNVRVLGWGNEQAQGKVTMLYRSPPHVVMDCYFSGGNVNGQTKVPLDIWVHVVHTYQKGEARLYVNGVLDVTHKSAGSPLAIKSPMRLWIGGWYNNYDFVGEIDEVRISNVVRSASWVKLEYENQKPMQTLVGPVVQDGDAFEVTPASITVQEGGIAHLHAKAGGAQKVYWTLKRDGVETLVAADRFGFTFDGGRVIGDQSAVLQFKAIYVDKVKTRDIPITIKEAVPEPEFTLQAPARWDGRSTIEVVPIIANMSQMKAKGEGDLKVAWSMGDIAVIKEELPDKLRLTRSQNSGNLTVTATLTNGGASVSRSVRIAVTEPAHDAWVAQQPAKVELPLENQFYARDDKNEGTLHCKGALDVAADMVFLRVYADDMLFIDESRKPGADRSYAFAVKLKPGLIRYKAVLGTKVADQETVLHTADNLVCGDAFLINGQSNAVATDWGKSEYNFTSPWIRSFGSTAGDPNNARLKEWHLATARGNGGRAQIGYWGMELARQLVEKHKMPICILNGAVGGTRIDQHQRNPSDPEDVTTIYGRLLWRVKQAGLTYGIRGILWHQGENDQGADGPTGGFGYETYRQYFIDMAAGWKQDFPNVQQYYIFQIWPKSCSMGVNGSDNHLREVQRNLPTAFSRMSIMSTLGIDPPGGCHYPAEGYAEFARLIRPLVERDHYGEKVTASITPANLKRAFHVGKDKDSIVMEFDQPVKWDDSLKGQFYLDGESGRITSGSAAGNRVTLKLAAPFEAKKITYLDSKAWSQKTLLRGENGIAALTFCDVPIVAAE